jgi:MAF protein
MKSLCHCTKKGGFDLFAFDLQTDLSAQDSINLRCDRIWDVESDQKHLCKLAMTEYILASKSPRRKKLLGNLIESFLVIDPDLQEDQDPGEQALEYVIRIAREKALAAGDMIPPELEKDGIILAADTIVVDNDKILGKPLDSHDAARMLLELRGKTHRVDSGIAVYNLAQRTLKTNMVCSEVLMREYTDKEIEDYIASGDPFDKAGAYAIQNPSFNPAPTFRSCYANVMGLPLCHLSLLMKEVGGEYYPDVADRCQESINYQCPVYAGILSPAEG